MGHLPEIAGTIPQWGLLGIVILAALKLIPILRKQTLDADTSQAATWKSECDKLREELRKQQDQCHKDNEDFRAQIQRLHEEIFGMRRQHITEQIELINVIMNSVDAPQLKGMLNLLERVQVQLAAKGIGALVDGAQKTQ